MGKLKIACSDSLENGYSKKQKKNYNYKFHCLQNICNSSESRTRKLTFHWNSCTVGELICKDNIQRDCKHNFKRLEAKTAISIYNGTLDIFIWLKWRRLCRFTDLKTVSFEKMYLFHLCREPTNSYLIRQSFQGYQCKLGNAIFAWRDTKDYDYSPFNIENQGQNSRLEQEGCIWAITIR